jgi:hypothetical protein
VCNLLSLLGKLRQRIKAHAITRGSRTIRNLKRALPDTDAILGERALREMRYHLLVRFEIRARKEVHRIRINALLVALIAGEAVLDHSMISAIGYLFRIYSVLLRRRV